MGWGFGDWATAIGTGGISVPFQLGRDRAEDRQDQDIQREEDQAEARYNNVLSGMKEGERKGEELTGFTGEELGGEVRGYAERAKKRATGPSAAASAVRRTGQKRQEQLSRRGGTEAEKESSALQASQAAGAIQDAATERRESAYGRVLSGMMATQSALAPAYGQMYNAASHISAPRQNVGLLSGLGLV